MKISVVLEPKSSYVLDINSLPHPLMNQSNY